MADQNTLENLATMFLASQSRQPMQREPIETVNIGGTPILVNRPMGFNERLSAAMPPLQNLAANYLYMDKIRKRQDYMKQINDIMGSNVPLEDVRDETGKVSKGKLGQMAQLVMQIAIDDPELAKSLGADEIIGQYTKMGGRGISPTTIPEGMEITGYDQKGQPMIRKIKPPLPTVEEKVKTKYELTQATKQAQEESKARDLLRDAELIQRDVDELMGFLDEVPTGRIGGTLAEIEKNFGTDSPQALGLRDYEDSLELFLGKIAKTFGGEVGVLTDRDIERIRKSFPKFWMTKAERRNRINFVKQYIQRRVDVFTKKSKGLTTQKEQAGNKDPLGLR